MIWIFLERAEKSWIGWNLTSFTLVSTFAPPPCKCTVSGCCLVIRQRNREAFQVMTVLVFKRFECLQHKKACSGSEYKYKYKFMTVLVLKQFESLKLEKTRLWRSGVTRATLTSHYHMYYYYYCSCCCVIPSIFYHTKPFWSVHTTGGKFTAGIRADTILIHLDPITPSVLGPFDVA